MDCRKLVIQRFIDAMLHVNGHISNADIQRVFDVSRTTASINIAQYRALYTTDHKLVYVGSIKRWETTDAWLPNMDFWEKVSPSNFLKSLSVVQGTPIPFDKSLLGE